MDDVDGVCWVVDFWYGLEGDCVVYSWLDILLFVLFCGC